MSERQIRRGEVLTGLFVITAILILAFATLWITGAKVLGERRESYEVKMKSAGGVRRGDQVRVSGVEVGRVREVMLEPGTEWPVTFQVVLDADLPVATDSRARFASDGLLGSSYLEIDTGSGDGEPLAPGEPILGSDVRGITEAMSGIDDLTAQATVLIDETTALVREVRGQLGRSSTAPTGYFRTRTSPTRRPA